MHGPINIKLMYISFIYSSSRNGCVCQRTFKLLVLPEVLLLCKNNGRPSFSGKSHSKGLLSLMPKALYFCQIYAKK